MVVGLVVAKLFVFVRRRIDDTVLDTTLSFLAPFAAFLAAEEISIDGAHPSGVLAVVVTGVVLGQHSAELQSATSRLAEEVNWRTVQFVLENAVFLLIGLQLPTVIDDVSSTDLSTAGPRRHLRRRARGDDRRALDLGLPGDVPAAWMIPSIGRNDPAPSWRVPLVVGWAGMRGVVTLAAVFALPEDTPQRPVLVLVAFTVVAGTLLVQGSTLPWLVRRLHLPGPDPAEDALAAAAALQSAASAGIARLAELEDSLPGGGRRPGASALAGARRRGMGATRRRRRRHRARATAAPASRCSSPSGRSSCACAATAGSTTTCCGPCNGCSTSRSRCSIPPRTITPIGVTGVALRPRRAVRAPARRRGSRSSRPTSRRAPAASPKA